MTSHKEIVLTKNQVRTLEKHAKECTPNESCAILFGISGNEQILVREVFLTKNIENSPVNFTIANEELIKAYDDAEKRLLDVIVIFHSHPASVAYPSATDMKYMEINPVPWIIFSNLDNEFKAYIFDSGIVHVPLKIS